MDDNSLERAESELAGWSDPVTRLREALQKNEFELYCQPIVALVPDGQLSMAEVLVRLREEERALIPPGDFLPAFEHFGMMSQLDRWVVFHVVQRIARGSRIGRFTVNVSTQSLQEAEFLPYVEAALRKYGVAPAALAFEIDESDLLARLDPAARFAAAARKLGCGVLIDGFGRRAASFTQLKVLRTDFLKIDGSVVRKLLGSEVARTKMNAIQQFADALGIGLVAECVEEKNILAHLRTLKVSHAQGFGVQPPRPIDELA